MGILIEGGEESGPWKDGIMLSREERKALEANLTGLAVDALRIGEERLDEWHLSVGDRLASCPVCRETYWVVDGTALECPYDHEDGSVCIVPTGEWRI